MIFPTKTAGACAAIALLSACGGGGGGGPQTVFTYQPLGVDTVAGESDVAAVGYVRNGATLVGATEIQVGTLDRQSQQLTIGDVVIDGVYDDENGSWTGNDTVVTGDPESFGSENFAFLVPVNVEPLNNGPTSRYIIGVVSRTQDLPTGGTFTFNGSAEVTAILEGQADRAESGGTLVLTSDFQTDLVNATISDLGGSLPFNRVELQGMTIGSTGTGATFSGGTIAFLDPDGIVTPIPGTTMPSASGAFFGGDPRGPVEVGGAFTVIGSDNINNIFGIFAGSRTNAPAP